MASPARRSPNTRGTNAAAASLGAPPLGEEPVQRARHVRYGAQGFPGPVSADQDAAGAELGDFLLKGVRGVRPGVGRAGLRGGHGYLQIVPRQMAEGILRLM